MLGHILVGERTGGKSEFWNCLSGKNEFLFNIWINMDIKGSLCLTKDERAPIDGKRCAAFTFLVLSFTEDSVKPSWGSSLANAG